MGAHRRWRRRWQTAAPVWRCAVWGAFCASAVSAHAVQFSEIARFNVAAHGIGDAASTLAWQGGRLFLGGYNMGYKEACIVEVVGAGATGIIAAPTFGPRFSPFRAPGTGGYSGLALSADGSRLAAALYTGAPETSGLQLFTLGPVGAAPPNPLRKTIVGGSGVAFDPGILEGGQVVGAGVAWVATAGHGVLGADRRMLQDPVTLADVWTTSTGMQWYPEDEDGVLRRTRDIDFDPVTGDMYARIFNDVGVARRTGGNSIDPEASVLLIDGFDAPTVDNQHLAFLSTPQHGGMVIYNDRQLNLPASQPFADVVKLVGSTGGPLTPNFTFLDGYQPADGAGSYDFDFDEASQTLALLDTSNSQVHIFGVGAAAVVLDNGDFDSDGDVDGADFLAWQRNVGAAGGTATHAQGDADGDQLVTGSDLTIWRTQFGVAAATAHAVPEPAGMVLLGAASASLALGRPRRRTARFSRG